MKFKTHLTKQLKNSNHHQMPTNQSPKNSKINKINHHL